MIKPDLRDERELRYLAGELSFDERANYHADIDDLKPVLLEHYLRTVGSELYKSVFDRPLQDVASDMSLLGCQSECRKPLNAALLLFSDHPEEFFPYAQIEVVDKPDPTGIGMVERFSGALWTGSLLMRLHSSGTTVSVSMSRRCPTARLPFGHSTSRTWQ